MTDAWRQLPTIEQPSPVLALQVIADSLWAGGFGGVAVCVNGYDWLPGGTGLPLGTVTALATAEGVIFAGGEGGLARSVDGGLTWLPGLLPDRTGIVSGLALSPRFLDDGTALAATLANGVMRSTDSGRSWQRSSFGLDSDEVLALAWGAGDTVVAATATGLFRSPNAGRAWKAVVTTTGSAFVALANVPGGEMVASPAVGQPLRSSRSQAEWSPLTGLPSDVQTSSILGVDAETLLLGTADGLLRSTGGGTGWELVSSEQVLTLVDRDQRIYAGTDRGVMVSDNGGENWKELPPPPLHDLHRLSIVDGVPLISGRNSPPIVLDAGGTWMRLQDAPVPQTGLFVAPDGALMTSTADGLFRSDDLGLTWTLVVAGDAGRVAQMTFADRERGWAGGSSALLCTRDAGQTWNIMPAPFGVLPLVALQAIPASGRATISLIAATFDERRHAVSLWRSDDGGERWVRGADSFTNWPVVATCDDPPATAFGNTIAIRQIDGSWRQAVVGKDGIRRIVGWARLLLALAGDGLWWSDDVGATWERREWGLPIAEVLDVALDQDGFYVLLAGGRVWRREV